MYSWRGLNDKPKTFEFVCFYFYNKICSPAFCYSATDYQCKENVFITAITLGIQSTYMFPKCVWNYIVHFNAKIPPILIIICKKNLQPYSPSSTVFASNCKNRETNVIHKLFISTISLNRNICRSKNQYKSYSNIIEYFRLKNAFICAVLYSKLFNKNCDSIWKRMWIFTNNPASIGKFAVADIFCIFKNGKIKISAWQ